MNPAAPATPGPVLDRRRFGAVAVLGAGTLAVGACTGRRTDTEAPAPPEEDPDLSLVAEVSAVLTDRVRLLEETVARHPGLTSRLAALTDAHRAHQAVLSGAIPAEASPPPAPSPSAGRETRPAPAVVPARPRPALAAVVAAGTAGVDDLTRLAFRARSGPLARLLAGMAASTAMHVAHLEAQPPLGGTP